MGRQNCQMKKCSDEKSFWFIFVNVDANKKKKWPGRHFTRETAAVMCFFLFCCCCFFGNIILISWFGCTWYKKFMFRSRCQEVQIWHAYLGQNRYLANRTYNEHLAPPTPLRGSILTANLYSISDHPSKHDLVLLICALEIRICSLYLTTAISNVPNGYHNLKKETLILNGHNVLYCYI